ncbi:hypothetical protein BD560DRAFT_416662 [Blakeslea trispora]|nr:hypothetical protein BD560DRAFT_416662 [Blakeslea trispora]
MAPSLCFWSILTHANNDLKFLHVSQKIGSSFLLNTCITMNKALVHHSLFEFIHPSETEMAKRDMMHSIKQRTLAGSVTRCQFKKINLLKDISYALMESSLLPRPMKSATQCQNHLIPGNQNSWEVIDIVLYTITDTILLAFFHSAETTTKCRLKSSFLASGVTCDASGQKTFTQQDGDSLLYALNEMDRFSGTTHAQTPYRIFTVSGRTDNIPLFRWISSNFNSKLDLEEAQRIGRTLTSREYNGMSFRKEDQQTYNSILNSQTQCSRHSYASDTVSFLSTESSFDRISIPYGDVVFEYYRIIPSFTISHREGMHIQTSPVTESVSSRSTSPLGLVLELSSSLYLQKQAISYGPNLQKNSECFVAGTTMTTELTDIHSDNFHEKQLIHYTATTATKPNKSMPVLFQKFRVYSNSSVQLHSEKASFKRHSMEKRDESSCRKHHCQDSDELMSSSTKVCVRCHTRNSPEWRRGPDGNKT